MDMRMPKVGGAEAIRQIRATPVGKTVFILAVSASVFADSQQEAFAAGADDFLSKPFREADLLERLRARLGVEYIFVDVPGPRTPGVMVAPNHGLARSALARLPSSLREQIHIAAINADYDRLMALADQLAGLDADSARVLRQTIERFDYQRLIEYAQGVEEHA
jgi:CheY-like chemotaxis protein